MLISLQLNVAWLKAENPSSVSACMNSFRVGPQDNGFSPLGQSTITLRKNVMVLVTIGMLLNGAILAMAVKWIRMLLDDWSGVIVTFQLNVAWLNAQSTYWCEPAGTP
eukprot:TRINITY_DN1177_c0_g1_i20.p3 TRINITY_DN1177_c0_g1~~TRINITY_DN1177_c0_g1_i20.p3  ORF type:complete len:108 (-),score=5.61 TRINITY_DN1177_c0_g1_i20:139-462(-)